MTEINAGVVFIAVMILMFVGALWLSSRMSRKAMCTVINNFRQVGATRPELASEPRDLGLNRMAVYSIVRDYRPLAFQALLSADVIKSTSDGRYYLSEDKLRTFSRIPCV